MMDIFNLSVSDLDKDEKKANFAQNEFKPNPKDAKDGIYRALIRPVYWMKNPTKSYIPKTTFFFGKEDGNDSSNYFFDSAYSIGEECLGMNTFFDLKREGKTSARAEELAKSIKPKSSFFYLILVESDAANPENEGKLMVYKAPIQVHKLIQGAINVSDEDKKIGIKPCNIFDPFKGKSLRLSINTVGGNWNYNGTVNLSDAGPIKFEGKDLTVDKKEKFIELLKTGDALMEPYEYKKLDDNRYKLLLSIISQKTGKKFPNLKLQKLNTDIEIEGLEDETDETEDFLGEIQKETKKEVKKEVPKKEVKKEEDIDDNIIDDILDGLDV
jgi:hypothetical protein